MVDNYSGISGLWEPHSSSVDFCEPNYLLDSRIAEPHNVWSSLVISLFALLGFLWGDPLHRLRYKASFLCLFIIGIGSATLHTTLHWLPQSFDEVPMLWQTWTFLCAMAEYSPFTKSYSAYIDRVAIILVILQTTIYYQYRQFYGAFLVSYISLVVVIIVWQAILVFETREKKLFDPRYLLFRNTILSYVLFGSTIWVVDMHACGVLMPYYKQLGGLTFHVLWHIAAGYGTYNAAILLILIRQQKLGGSTEEVSLRWIGGILPICVIEEGKKD